MISANDLMLIIQWTITNLIHMINLFDTMIIGNYSIMDYILMIAYLAVTFNFISAILNKKYNSEDSKNG